MHRLEAVRDLVDRLLQQQPDELTRRCGFVHLYGVSAVSALLALRRGFPTELCTIAGMLHDLATYETGDPSDHAQRSAVRAMELLTQIKAFTTAEIVEMAQMISAHSAKQRVDAPLCELLKDADVVQHYLYNPTLLQEWTSKPRLKAVAAELGLGLV